jgi:Uma2 family endonuclease
MAEPAYRSILPATTGGRAWPEPGAWTYGDYCSLPEDGRRYEVIRGDLYVTPAPTVDHQRVVMRLSWKLQGFVAEHQLGEVFAVALDILLPADIAAPVQPDLVYFRTGNEPRPGATNFRGVPDLVVEVLSPGTRRYDTTTKLAAYRDAGVPEVWLADPRARTLVVHGKDPEGAAYVELSRGVSGGTVASRLLPGLVVVVDEIFGWPR